MAGAGNTVRHTIQGLFCSDPLELQSNSYALKIPLHRESIPVNHKPFLTGDSYSPELTTWLIWFGKQDRW